MDGFRLICLVFEWRVCEMGQEGLFKIPLLRNILKEIKSNMLYMKLEHFQNYERTFA